MVRRDIKNMLRRPRRNIFFILQRSRLKNIIPLSKYYVLDNWKIYVGRNLIVASGGKEFKVEPKMMAVLKCLMDAQGEPVSKDFMMEKVWAGTMVTEPSHYGDQQPVFSPTGQQLAFGRMTTPGVRDIWTYDFRKRETSRITWDKVQIHGIAWVKKKK